MSSPQMHCNLLMVLKLIFVELFCKYAPRAPVSRAHSWGGSGYLRGQGLEDPLGGCPVAFLDNREHFLRMFVTVDHQRGFARYFDDHCAIELMYESNLVPYDRTNGSPASKQYDFVK